MNLSKLHTIRFTKLLTYHNAAVLCNISTSSNNSSKKQRKFYRRPEKPAVLPAAGSASSLAAELFVGTSNTRTESNNNTTHKLDELQALVRSIDHLPVLVEVDKAEGDESILASDRIPADIPQGFNNTMLFEYIYLYILISI